MNIRRLVTWLGVVDGEELRKVIESVAGFLKEDENESIHFLLDSLGGFSQTCFAFYDLMRHVLKPNLVVYGTGDIGSAGVIIFLAAKKRYITPNTVFFFHEIGRGFGVDGQRRSVSEVEEIMKNMRETQEKYIAVICRETGGKLSKELLRQWLKENKEVHAEEAVQFGLAQEIIQEE